MKTEGMKDMGPQDAIDAKDAIVEIQVSDLAKSREWYSRLFGKGPDLERFPGNVEFKKVALGCRSWPVSQSLQAGVFRSELKTFPASENG